MTRIQDPRDQRPLILHVVLRFDVGGLENGIVNLINRLPGERWRHGIIALDEVSETFFSRLHRNDVFHCSLRKPPGHAVRLYPRLYRLFREQRPAIVHTRNLAALEASVPAWAAGIPVRVHGEHGRDIADLDGSNSRYQLVRKLYRPFVHHYVAMSRDLEQYLRRRVHIPERKVSQIYNGVDTTRFQPGTGARSAIPGCPFTEPGLWICGTVGRMQAVKAQTRLAEAFALAVGQNTDTAKRMRLIMVGDGPLRDESEKILVRAGLRDLAWFPGERADIPEIIRGLDCFVLPSLAEGISNTILEAMATGLPVVATRVGGNAEIVDDGITGRLVPSGDGRALADAILNYFRAPDVLRRHGEAARRASEQRFSLDRMVSDYEKLYLRLLRAHVRPQARRRHSRPQLGPEDRR